MIAGYVGWIVLILCSLVLVGTITTAKLAFDIAFSLACWPVRLPNAQLGFDLTSQIVGSHLEPIAHALSTEGLWIGEVLARMGFSGASYFDQAYAADAALRQARHTDWATTIFVAN